MNLAIGQRRRIRLLKLGTDGVVDRVAVPCAVRALDIEVVPAVADNHPREQRSIVILRPLRFCGAATDFEVVQIKFIVALEIANHILRRIGAQHLSHA